MTLHDQLERLAERAEPDTGPTGSELWDRGTRYRRRMRTGTAAIAAGTLLGLVVLTGVSIGRAGPTPEPVPANAPAGLPSRLWEPSPWLPGSDEVGPPGEVAVLLESQSRHDRTGSASGVVAVSATTGDYRFLDLPDLAHVDFGPSIALAPDGRHVAYWTSGSPTDEPNTSMMAGGGPVTGFAVYDTATGQVRMHSVATRHGLSTDLLTWAGPSTLVVSYLQFQVGGREGYARGRDTWIWNVGHAVPTRTVDAERWGSHRWSVPADGRVFLDGRILDDTTLEVLDRPGSAAHLGSGAGLALSPDGTRLAGLWSPRPGVSRSPAPVAVARLDGPSGTTRVRSALDTYALVGWTDDDHVAAVGVLGRDRTQSGLHEIAVDDGSSRILMLLPDGVGRVQWATDLLGAPVVDRPAPPRPLDPRWVTAGLLALVVAGPLALWGWRRRVQP